MKFLWYHDRIISNYLRAKFKKPGITEHEFGNKSYQQLNRINRCFSSQPWGMLHDITNHVPHPFDIVTKNSYQPSSQSKTFGEICIDTAAKIANSTDRQIAVSWSGGIDSTVALVALLQTVEHDRITVVCNRASIDEFPSFYQDKIQNQLKTMSLVELSSHYKDFFTVSGDGGDTVWGVIDDSFWAKNQHVLNHRWQDVIDQSLVDMDFVEEFCSWSGTEINSWLDLRVWFYLCCKWQDKCMRPYYLRQDLTDSDTIAFYDVDRSFQNWTMNNLDRIIGATWQDYKIPAKEFIYQYHPDVDYLKNKSKVGSFTIDRDLTSTYETYTRIVVTDSFYSPRLPSWPFIDYAEFEDFNDQYQLIPHNLLAYNP